jgi:hypothetical protein
MASHVSILVTGERDLKEGAAMTRFWSRPAESAMVREEDG